MGRMDLLQNSIYLLVAGAEIELGDTVLIEVLAAQRNHEFAVFIVPHA